MQKADFYFLATLFAAPFVIITAFQPDYPLVVLQAAYLVSHIFWPAFVALVFTSLFMVRLGTSTRHHRFFAGWLLATYYIYTYLGGDWVPRSDAAEYNLLLRFPGESMLAVLVVLGLAALHGLAKAYKAARTEGGGDKQATAGGIGFTFIFSNIFAAAMIAGFVGVFLWLPSCEDQPFPRRTILGNEISLCRMAGCNEVAEIQESDCDSGQDCPTVYTCSN